VLQWFQRRRPWQSDIKWQPHDAQVLRPRQGVGYRWIRPVSGRGLGQFACHGAQWHDYHRLIRRGPSAPQPAKDTRYLIVSSQLQGCRQRSGWPRRTGRTEHNSIMQQDQANGQHWWPKGGRTLRIGVPSAWWHRAPFSMASRGEAKPRTARCSGCGDQISQGTRWASRPRIGGEGETGSGWALRCRRRSNA